MSKLHGYSLLLHESACATFEGFIYKQWTTGGEEMKMVAKQATRVETTTGNKSGSTEKVMLTKDGQQKLATRLEELRTVKRPAALQSLQDVRDSADWRDNAQMIQMQNALGLIDAEIHRLAALLEASELVTPHSDDVIVDVGETVLLQIDGATETYTIVSPAESDPDHGRISYESPLGRALLKRKVGDEIAITVPAGQLQYRIVAVE